MCLLYFKTNFRIPEFTVYTEQVRYRRIPCLSAAKIWTIVRDILETVRDRM